MILFSIVHALTHGGKGDGEIGLLAILATIANFFFLLGNHELLHGMAMSPYGARPTYEAGHFRI